MARIVILLHKQAAAILTVALLGGWPMRALAGESVCHGTPSNGSLENGVQIPASGSNFSPYSSLGVSLGRTYVHSKIAATIEAAYASLSASAPDKKYVYGESGWRDGGRIRPHRTHQNGTAVDFMVPVMDATGTSVALPTSALDKFGYGIEFDAKGRYKNLTIDFEAMADHLYALHEAAKLNGIGIARVIFDKTYIPRLYATKRGAFLKESIHFMKGEPWIRHDEHYHVDFAVRCQPLPG
jgi:penicillin-insensitive murein endopeptidase